MTEHLERLNAAQRAAATAAAPVLVLAGAGSGKTETLIRRVAGLILGGEAPDRLLCITFTAKAAGEMRGRLLALLPRSTALAQRQALDFDDLIARPVLAMQADPALAARWSSHWAEILVDEYQDTNHAQHALVRLLAGKPGRVFAVGDDLQAIYGWRGADVGHIRRFQKDYKAAPAPLKLETNYRSTPTILRAANAIAAEDPEALPKILRPADPKAPPGAAIVIREAQTPEDDGRAALAWVQALRRRQPELPWRECAVLVRAGFVAEPILAALRQAGIPVRLVTDREPEPPKEILATIAWLRLAMSLTLASKAARETWDPAADDAFRRACAFPARGIGGVLFGRLREHAAERGLALAQAVATLPVTPKERQGLEAVLGVAGEIADGVVRRKLGPADALRLAAEASEIAERLAPDGKLGQAWTAVLRAADQSGSVAAYCDGAALGVMPGEAEATDAVQVMTLHRAKGLEFDHVLLAGLEEGVWPHWQAEQQGAIAEERRLFYVGVTRARQTLQLNWLRQRRDWAGKPSRFLAEIPRALIEGAKVASGSNYQRNAGRADASQPARSAKPPTQAETDRLVAEFMARRGAKTAR